MLSAAFSWSKREGCHVKHDGRVAYDEGLANRIRELVAGEDGVTEQRTFGGPRNTNADARTVPAAQTPSDSAECD